MKYLVILAALTFSCFTNCAGLRLPHIDSRSISIDGNIDSVEWSNITEMNLGFEVWPGDSVPTEKQYQTKYWVFEDGNTLYIAVDAYDPEPSQIDSNLHRRDKISQQDVFSIYIDTFGKGQEAFAFRVTPNGGQADHIIKSNGDNKDWDGLWTSAGRLTKYGYSLEIAIPISNFRYPESSIQSWNMRFDRIAFRTVTKHWASSSIDRDNSCQICGYKEYSLFENAKQNSGLQFRPSIIATQSNSRDYPYQGAFTTEDDVSMGLDIRWSPNGSQVLNGTINPDFSQVEADEAQSAVNRLFSIFYSEKRPFFLEGEDYFDTNLRLVHSRNISDPEYGLKYTGRFDEHAIGVFTANDTTTNFYTPGQFGNGFESLSEKSINTVARYKYSLDSGSYFGALATRRDSSNYQNQVVSLDGLYRPTKSIRLELQYALSDNTFNRITKEGKASSFSYNFNTETDWHYIGYKQKDLDFNSGLGFITRTGVSNLYGGVGHVWHSKKKNGFIESVYLSANYSEQRLEDDTELNGTKAFSDNNIELNIYGQNQFELTFQPYSIAEFYQYKIHRYDGFYADTAYRFTSYLTLGGSIETGKEIDYSNNRLADGDKLKAWAKLNVGESFHVDFSIQNNSLKSSNTLILSEDFSNSSVNYSIDLHHHFRLTHQNIRSEFNEDEYGFFNDEKTIDSAYQLLYIFEKSSFSSLYIGYSTSGFRNSGFSRARTVEEFLFMKFNFSFRASRG